MALEFDASRTQASRILIEVCVDCFEVADAAVRAGADRLEVNNRLDLDGLTPDEKLVRECMALGVPVIAMARPETNNNSFTPEGFCYSDGDWARLINDARKMLDLGAAGIAAGALDQRACIDVERSLELREVCGDREFVFHRAFDVASDWKIADLLAGSPDRLLTSGRESTALQGRSLLKTLVDDGRLEILPASGINCDNALTIVESAGVTQLHGSFSKPTTKSNYANRSVSAIVFSEVERLNALLRS